MINANEYATREELEEAMYKDMLENVNSIILSDYNHIIACVNLLNEYMKFDFCDVLYKHDKDKIYIHACRIEEFTRDINITAQNIKNCIRVIPNKPE